MYYLFFISHNSHTSHKSYFPSRKFSFTSFLSECNWFLAFYTSFSMKSWKRQSREFVLLQLLKLCQSVTNWQGNAQSNASFVKSLQPKNLFKCPLCFSSWKALSAPFTSSYHSTYSRLTQPSLWKLHFSCFWGSSSGKSRAGLMQEDTTQKLLALALESHGGFLNSILYSHTPSKW